MLPIANGIITHIPDSSSGISEFVVIDYGNVSSKLLQRVSQVLDVNNFILRVADVELGGITTDNKFRIKTKY